MFQQILNYINDVLSWVPWLGLGGAGTVAGLSWFFGVSAVLGGLLRIIASISEVISPILQAIINLVVWFISYIIWPGLKNIIENVSSIITVIVIGLLIWSYVVVKDSIHYTSVQNDLNQCYVQLKKAGKPLPLRVSPKQLPTQQPTDFFKELFGF